MMSDFTAKQVGIFGEKYCRKYAKRKKGYKILGCNVTIGKLEADIIATDKNYIIIIEVKTRNQETDSPHRPADAVNFDKKQNLINFAKIYCENLPKKHKHKTPRIDVCEVYVEAGKRLRVTKLNYIENAVSR